MSWFFKPMLAGSGRELLSVPTGFNFTPPFSVYRSGDVYTTDFDTADYDFSDTAGVTYYFNNSTGSDSNSGLTSALPKKNINTVITALNSSPPAGGAVFILQTDYKDVYGASTTGIAFDLVVKSDVAGTKRRLSKEVTDGSAALVSGACYRFTRASGGAAPPIDLTWLDEFDKPKRLVNVASSAACISTAGSYYIENGSNVQFHLWDSRAPDANVRYMRASPVIYCTSTAVRNVYFQDIIFEGGTLNSLGAVEFTIAGNDSLTICASNCEFSYCEYGFKFWHGNSTVSNPARLYLHNCDLYHAAKDGGNYHNSTGSGTSIAPSVVEIDCTFRYNGYTLVSGGGTPNNNGSTMHDQGRIIRINTIATYNQNRNIHDVGSAQAWNIGCLASDAQEQSTATDSIDYVLGQNDGSETAEWWMDGCDIEAGSMVNLRVNTGSVLKYRNMDISAWAKVENGTVEAY